ncbi:MAG: YfiR family protein [Lentisphaeraceae bacterium]|nr:YfiR family protein [Lentisphaeraceae bacterium]
MIKTRHQIIKVSLALMVLALTSSAKAQKEYAVKAAYLCNFLKYTKFNDSNKKFTIAVIGQNPFGGHLKALNGKKIKGRTLKVIFLETKIANLPKNCHIIFISAKEALNQKEIIKRFATPNTLTIGDNKWFIRAGGHLNLVTRNNSIRFEVNHKSIIKQKLKISSKILRLAVNRELN